VKPPKDGGLRLQIERRLLFQGFMGLSQPSEMVSMERSSNQRFLCLFAKLTGLVDLPPKINCATAQTHVRLKRDIRCADRHYPWICGAKV